jgi:hypothetical protein
LWEMVYVMRLTRARDTKNAEELSETNYG